MNRLVIVLMLFCCIGCKDEPSAKPQQIVPEHDIAFDSKKWKEPGAYDNEAYPYREKMLKSLVDSKILKGKKRATVLNMLGEPMRTDSAYFFYKVSVKKLGILTLNAKTLVLKFSGLTESDTVQKVLIHG